MMDRRALVKDLLILTGRSASSLASEIGIHRPNIYTWLKKGGRDVGLERQNELLSRLGISGGTLSSARVHFWTLPAGDLSLVRILSWASPSSPFQLVSLAPDNEGGGESLPEKLPIAIYNFEKKIRILLRRKFDPLTPESEAIDSLVASGLAKWKNSAPDEISRIDSRIFKNSLAGNVSVEEYDRILGLGEETRAKGKSIQPVITEKQDLAKDLLKLRNQSISSAAKECGLNPSNVAGWLKGIPGRLSQEKQVKFLEYLKDRENMSSMTWWSFVAEMERRGLHPEEVLSMIESGRKEKS